MPGNTNTDLLADLIAGDVLRLRARLPAAGGTIEDGAPGLPNGLTPLMVAAACGHETLVELLLQHGADPSRRDMRGHSAAAYARAAGHPHLAERLDTVVDKEQTM
jgi:Ankyrin repeats (many copies)